MRAFSESWLLSNDVYQKRITLGGNYNKSLHHRRKKLIMEVKDQIIKPVRFGRLGKDKKRKKAAP